MSANTFGTGPRMCIGNRLALLTVKTAAVTVLRSYRFVTCDKTEVSRSSLLLNLSQVPVPPLKHKRMTYDRSKK